MAVKAAATAAAVAAAKRVAEGAAATLAPTALAIMGAGNRGDRQQSTKKQ
jgi:hypothetical protein